MVEVMKLMGPPSKCPMQALLHSVPPTLQQATTDPHLFWALVGSLSLVGSLLLSPGSWCTRCCCALQETIFQSCIISGSSMVGLMATSSKRAYAILTPRAPAPVAAHH